MSGNFFRGRHPITYERGFVQGAGRIIYAPAGTSMPDEIGDMLILDPDAVAPADTFSLKSPWTEIGFTKTGINITRNNAEEDFDVDQVSGSVRRRPTNWEMSVGTQLAEATMETFALAWELGEITENVPVGELKERKLGFGAPTSYTERLIAVLFQFPPEKSGGSTASPGMEAMIRAWIFGRCYRAAQESGMTLQKTGEQVSLPVRWNAQADTSKPQDEQFGYMLEQQPAPQT